MTGKMFKTCAIGAAAVGLIALTNLDAQAAVTFQSIVMAGGPAPGTAPGVVFGGGEGTAFGRYVLNEAGQVAFWGNVIGSSVNSSNDIGLWLYSGGELSLTARELDQAPGTATGVVFAGLGQPLLDDTGLTVFWGSLRGPGVDFPNELGIWSVGLASLDLIARTGESPPGTGLGVFFSQFSNLSTSLNPLVASEGHIAFEASLSGTSVDNNNDRGIWSADSQSLRLVARSGDVAPGTVPDVVYRGFGPHTLNKAGQTAFLGHLVGPGVDNSNFSGIWLEDSGSLDLIARDGDAAPDTDPGVVYIFLGNPVLNDVGQIAFRGSLTGPGVDATNDRGIWSEGSGSLNLVVREGDAVPDTAPGVVYSFLGDPVLNGVGQIAFRGSLTGPGVDATNDRGIWSESSGSLGLVAREGDDVPNMEPGVVFGDLNFSRPLLNGVGQIAFVGQLTGTGVDSTNDSGIWVTDLDGLLTLVVREGDLLDVNDDPLINDLRTISSVDLTDGLGARPTSSGGEDGRATSFNDASQLAFRLGFTDGSEGIFVATVPEPGTLAVFVVGATFALRQRHRRPAS